MCDEKYKKDVFLEAIKGTVPIKKKNINYKITPQTKTNQKNQDSKTLEKISSKPIKKNKYEKKESHKNLKIEKSNINKKLKRGLISIDKKIDLHGLSLEDAKSKFIETINMCFSLRKRCILFITGKGMNKNQNSQEKNKLFYGKIRNEFTKWIFEKEVSQKILSTEQASRPHGGDGAFLVYLRKNKN